MTFLRIFLLLVFCVTSYAQPKETRVALVIGNGSYKVSPLRNPVNDAKDMATKLRSLGFTVVERNNLTVKQIGSTLREFRGKLVPGSVALVFYAGHGLQIKGENYLPAVDADINGEEDVPTQSLSTKQIMDILGDAKTRLNLVFLDACRDNPYARGFRSGSRGLSKESAPSGTLISFATRPGSVASDGDGRNGLYTGALLDAMDNLNQPIEQLLKRVVGSVKAASKSQQEPWMEGSIEGDFCFGQCDAAPITRAEVSDDRALWDAIKDSRDVNDLKVYLKKFPTGLFAEIANNRIKQATPVPDLVPTTQNKPQLDVYPQTIAAPKASENISYAADRRTTLRQNLDEAIAMKVKLFIKDNLQMESRIKIDVFNGLLFLTGDIGSIADKNELLKFVKAIPDVETMIDELALVSTSFFQRAGDTIIEGRIKAVLIDAKNLSVRSIKFIVVRGKVYLTGRLTERELAQAVGLIDGGKVAGIRTLVPIVQMISEDELKSLNLL